MYETHSLILSLALQFWMEGFVLWSTRSSFLTQRQCSYIAIWHTVHFGRVMEQSPQENTTKPQWETSMGFLIEGDRSWANTSYRVCHLGMGEGCKGCKAPKRLFRPFFHISCSTIFVSSLPTLWCFVVRVDCSRFWWWVYSCLIEGQHGGFVTDIRCEFWCRICVKRNWLTDSIGCAWCVLGGS